MRIFINKFNFILNQSILKDLILERLMTYKKYFLLFEFFIINDITLNTICTSALIIKNSIKESLVFGNLTFKKCRKINCNCIIFTFMLMQFRLKGNLYNFFLVLLLFLY